jgi:hypothetical protein
LRAADVAAGILLERLLRLLGEEVESNPAVLGLTFCENAGKGPAERMSTCSATAEDIFLLPVAWSVIALSTVMRTVQHASDNLTPVGQLAQHRSLESRQ